MKNASYKGFLAGMLTMLLIVSLVGSASAVYGKVQKELEYKNIGVILDGKKLDLKDASGKSIEPFMFDGTTYLPVRAISNTFGYSVNWDSATSSVLIKSPVSFQNSNEVLLLLDSNKELRDIANSLLLMLEQMSSWSGLIVFDSSSDYSSAYTITQNILNGAPQYIYFEAQGVVQCLEPTNPYYSSAAASSSAYSNMLSAIKEMKTANEALLTMSKNRSNMGGATFQNSYNSFSASYSKATSMFKSSASSLNAEYNACLALLMG